jgi:(+)-trans-carveol dehydrogenase
MTGRVEGKVAFVTGAARGQGRSHAVRLAQEGADIIAIDICGPIREGVLDTAIPASTPEDLAETADLVKGHNRRIVTAEVDVRDYDALKAAVDSGVEQLGRLDVIVANAGIGNGGDTLDQTSQEDWTEMIDINLSGVWKSVKAGVPHIFTGGRGGSIILTSSRRTQGLPAHRPLRRRQARCRGADASIRSRAGAEDDSSQLGASNPCEDGHAAQ